MNEGDDAMSTSDALSEEISRIGHEIYETRLRSQVETEENIGRLISIDIHTGDYEIGDKLRTTMKRLRARRPQAEIWTERIGYNAVYAVGGSLRRVDR
jgi:hypothetical protein